MSAVATRFDKFQPMTQLTMHPAPGVPYSGDWIVFAQINQPVGRYRRYFVIFQQGDDEEKTRFFITNSGARSYYEFLIGSSKAKQGNPEVWGSKSFEQLKHMVEGTCRG